MGKKWSNIELEFLKKNYQKYKISDISEILDRPYSSIPKKIKELGISKMWSSEEDEILRKFYPDKEFSEYEQLLQNRSFSSCLNRANVLGLKKTKHKKRNFKYRVDHHFFNKSNNLNSYWAGFIAADGYIDKKYHRIGIKLSIKDISQLEKFKIDINTDSPIRRFKRKSFGEIREYCIIDIYSDFIKNDLCNIFSIKHNKTFNMQVPNISGDQRFSFIAGLIDGDGSIFNKSKNIISIVGDEKILLWIKEVLNEIVDVSKISINKKGKISSFAITGNRCIEIKDKMKKLNIPLMERKWEAIK